MTKRSLASLALAAGLAAAAVPSAPALADGAASTRNIILGGAAAAVGALTIINHNKQVHAREAEMARQQAATEQNANNAWAAYASEKQAYEHEASLVGEYKKEVSYQHQVVLQLRHQLALANRPKPPEAAPAPVGQAQPPAPQPVRVASVSYGWGSL